jgi:hypothetical protein
MILLLVKYPGTCPVVSHDPMKYNQISPPNMLGISPLTIHPSLNPDGYSDSSKYNSMKLVKLVIFDP